jgi:hypothetical protein
MKTIYDRKTLSFLYLWVNPSPRSSNYKKNVEISIRWHGKVRFYFISEDSKSWKRLYSLVSQMDNISLISQYTGRFMTNTYVWGD